jgi:response regulator RpfG family c-di-GMP phosphodiesterase
MKLSSWSVFLFLASVTVGTLYEQNERRLQDLKNAYIGIVEILRNTSNRRIGTQRSFRRVSELAMETAIAMELPRAQVDNIRAAGLLHDIGKIEISADVLGKAAHCFREKALMDSHAMKEATFFPLSAGVEEVCLL